jgi:iron-sulfur cluster assembly accessory protein
MDSIANAPPFRVTDRAAQRIAAIAAEQGGGLALRLAVDAGGCSGFQYRFDLTSAAEPEDLVIEQSGARVIIDPASMDLLAGSELDFTEALMGAHFAVRNPNAVSSCGCGTSFSVE